MTACVACGAALGTAKFCPECGTRRPADTTSAGARKTLTVLFSDIVGSTTMGERHDPEALRAVLARYFGAMRTIIERHGGLVEKFIGDAVVAFFGLPVAHEDDALRAVRAAVEMLGTLGGLNDDLSAAWGLRMEIRIGVNTGLVVVGSEGTTLATGDPVNVAARLQTAAAPGEVLIGEVTHRLVREAVTATAVPPLGLKGKAQPVPAWRVTAVSTTGDRRSASTAPLVGRQDELGRLLAVCAASATSGRGAAVTVAGEAGAGKSRLVAEMTQQLAGEARVLWGRCLSYGDGTGFWALREIVRAAAGIGEATTEEAALAQVRAMVEQDPTAQSAVEVLASLAGVGTGRADADDIRRAVLRMVEALTADRPTVIVVDDVHWAANELLDVLDHLIAQVRGSAVVVLLTRPDEAAEPRRRGQVIHLSALGPIDVDQLVAEMVGPTVAAALAEPLGRAAGGNPLFVEQLLAMLVDEGRLRPTATGWEQVGDLATITVPPSLAAVLAARLDRLPPNERRVLGAASVIGQVFYQAALTTMSDQPGAVIDAALGALLSKQFVESGLAPDGAVTFRFTHVLVRDATYDAMPKAIRASAHETFARWLDANTAAVSGSVDEFVGHHLEQTFRLRAELGPPDEGARAIASEAAHRLAQATRNQSIDDGRASAALLQRAAALAPPAQAPRLHTEAGYALAIVGELPAALDLLRPALDVASSNGDEVTAQHAEIGILRTRMNADRDVSRAEVEPAVAQALEVFGRAGDELGLARAYGTLLHLYNLEGRWTDGEAVVDRILAHAAAAGSDREAHDALVFRWTGLAWGPTPATEALARLEREGDLAAGVTMLQGARLTAEGMAAAMLGDAARARRVVGEIERLVRTEDSPLATSGGGMTAAQILILIGDHAGAESLLRHAAKALRPLGERAWLSTIVAMLGHTQLALGDVAGAAASAQEALELAPDNDAASQGLARSLAAHVEALHGNLPAALRLADEAVAALAGSDEPQELATAHRVRAEVLSLSGRLPEARESLRAALAEHERKENLVDAERIKAKIEAVSGHLDDDTVRTAGCACSETTPSEGG